MLDPSGAPLDPGQQAVLAAFATAAGGSLAALAGVNVQGAMTAAQNEALNNSGLHPGQDGLLSALTNAAYALMPWLPGNPVTQAISQAFQGPVYQPNGAANPPADDLGNVTGGSGGGNNPSAPAVVTSFAVALCAASAGEACGLLGLVSLGAPNNVPSNATLAIGNGSGGSTGSSESSSATQTPFQRGIQFQNDALSALDLPPNTTRVSVTLPDGTPVVFVPDAVGGTTYIEVKDVVNLSNSNQFRGYAASGNPIELIVSPNTKTISKPLQTLIYNTGGSIQVFDSATGKFSVWRSK
ncbi:putative toxin [Paraburkholderia tropica]|uniref:putative toxin n=1 Tax=Paraburkholderia tropica TaxID=92647 RepID=UPI001F23758F|nr:putative toxin [Paraburkholderia tropica]